MTGGSDGEIQDTLQAAANTVVALTGSMNLSCSPQKSQLLLLPSHRGGEKHISNIQVILDDVPVTRVDRIRVLGLHIQSNRLNTYTLKTLHTTVDHTLRLLGRVSNKHGGLKEAELLRLVQAFVISKITFTTPYLHFLKSESDQIDILLRKAYKFALGVPIRTSTERLMRTGTFNTLAELGEAHIASQYNRLSNTVTGRHILQTLSVTPASITKVKYTIPHHIHENLYIPPLPKNMHPEHQKQRRMQRARALKKQFSSSNDVLYVDAADYGNRHHYAISVINSHGQVAAAASVLASSSEEAEEAAIALALTIPSSSVIISDSKTAIYNFGAGRVSKPALSLLLHHPLDRLVALIWTPAHAGLAGNEAAHASARGFTVRAHASDVSQFATNEAPFTARDRLISFHDICTHYRLERLTFPPLTRKSSRRCEILWRQLQTRTFLSPYLLHRIHPSCYPSPSCKFCASSTADLNHIMWRCPKHPLPPFLKRLISSEEQWEAALRSSRPAIQEAILEWAERVEEDYFK